MEKKLISFINVDTAYSNKSTAKKILHNVSFNVDKGDCFGVIGESGSGKSTIIKTLLGLLKCTNGYVEYEGNIINGKRFDYLTFYKLINFYKNSNKYEISNILSIYKKSETINTLKYGKKVLISLKIIINNLYEINKHCNNISFEVKNIDDVILELNNFYSILESKINKNTNSKNIFVQSDLSIFSHLIKFNNFTVDKKIITDKKKIDQKVELTRKMQIVMQDPSSSLNERMTVFEIVAEGINNFKNKIITQHDIDAAKKYFKIDNISTKKVIEYLVYHYLDIVSLPKKYSNNYIQQLSGGQKQRVAIARALIMKPEVLIGDEPISSLDVSIRAQILNLLKKIQKEHNLTIIFLAHDLSIVRKICNKLIVLRNGRIVEYGDTNKIFANPVHPYTRNLLASALFTSNIRDDREKINDDLIEFDKQEKNKSNIYEYKKVQAEHFVLEKK